MAARTTPDFAALAEAPQCADCTKPQAICVCALLQPQRTRHRLVVLQHPQENDNVLGTVPLLARGVADVTVRVGLSWPSLSKALQDPQARAQDYALVFPLTGVNTAPGAAGQRAAHVLCGIDGKGLKFGARRLRGAVLLDGTWSQAKTLLWRNPWLRKLPRLVLAPSQPSIYGRLRREPRAGLCSTLEAAVGALEAMGEPETVRAPLLRALRTMAQRLRDSSKAP